MKVLSPSQRTRRNDPDTSLEAAASVNVSEQSITILWSYAKSDNPLLDVEAYQLAGFPPTACDGQRCSDLRREGLIARTGERAQTPSGRRGHLCEITQKGWEFLATLLDKHQPDTD